MSGLVAAFAGHVVRLRVLETSEFCNKKIRNGGKRVEGVSLHLKLLAMMRFACLVVSDLNVKCKRPCPQAVVAVYALASTGRHRIEAAHIIFAGGLFQVCGGLLAFSLEQMHSTSEGTPG